MLRATQPGPDLASQALYLLEAARWPDGVVCPCCGCDAKMYVLRSRPESVHKLRAGIRKCGTCRRRFTVITGTILADSHIRPDQWVLALEIAARDAGKLNPAELQRQTGLKSYRSARFMCLRIEWALRQPPFKNGKNPPVSPADLLRLVLQVRPTAGMPRPGAHRQKSVWAETEEDFE